MKLTRTNLKKLIQEVVKESAEIFDLGKAREERESQRLEDMLRKAEDTLLNVMQPVQDVIDNLKSSKIVDYRTKSPGEIEALVKIRDAVADYLLDSYPKVSAEEPGLDPMTQKYEDEERAIKRAGPSPQPTDKEHADYMSLYDPEDIEPLREMIDPETMTVIQGFAKVIDNFGAATYPALAAMFAMSVKEVADTVRSYAAKRAGVNVRKR